MSKLPRVSGKEVVSALKRAGFVLIRTRGSHQYLYHHGKDKLVTVPVHSGKILAPKTLKSILGQAGLSVNHFIEILNDR